MSDNLHRLRATFDSVAQLYDRVRPGYPAALFGDVVALSAIPPAGRILEVGCGTGQATLPFARRGYQIQCVELGAGLAAVAQQNLAPFPNATVHLGAFESWPLPEEPFDLLISATAFHWIDPAMRYGRAAQALKPGGSIALFWNQHVKIATDDGFFDDVQVVYERETPNKGEMFIRLPTAEELGEPVKAEIDASGLFGEVVVRKYLWEQIYDAATYIDVLGTYSDHLDQPAAERERLFRGIAEMIDTQYGGRITKGYQTILYFARRI
jgi:SAM-dependent methyltransferase